MPAAIDRSIAQVLFPLSIGLVLNKGLYILPALVALITSMYHDNAPSVTTYVFE
jgi:hypothetical protein